MASCWTRHWPITLATDAPGHHARIPVVAVCWDACTLGSSRHWPSYSNACSSVPAGRSARDGISETVSFLSSGTSDLNGIDQLIDQLGRMWRREALRARLSSWSAVHVGTHTHRQTHTHTRELVRYRAISLPRIPRTTSTTPPPGRRRWILMISSMHRLNIALRNRSEMKMKAIQIIIILFL